VLTGESTFMSHFASTGKKRIAFASPYPGKNHPNSMAELTFFKTR